MVKIPKSKKLYSDEGGFDYLESDPEYDPSSGDPLRKNRKMDFIGGEMDELASTGYRGGSTAGGPLSNPTQFGPKDAKDAIPFEGQQRQALSPQRGVEEAIESALDQEISNLEKAVKSGDVTGEMKATGEISRLQKELSKELKVSKAAQETMGETYETAALRKRVESAYGGRVDPGAVEYMIEDAKPLPTTTKGKGKGIKSSEAIIKTGLESKEIPYDTLKSGDYSFSKSSLGQASVEKALREGAAEGSPDFGKYKYMEKPKDPSNMIKRTQPYDYRDPIFGETGGILGKASKDPGGPTFTGVDAQGNILQPKMPDRPDEGGTGTKAKKPDAPKTGGPGTAKGFPGMNDDIIDAQEAARNFDSLDNYPSGETIPESPNLPDARLQEQGYTPGGREIKKFNAGGKISGNKVGSVTPDAPKAVVSNEGFSMKKAFDDGVAQGMTSRQAQKNAERLQRLSKIKGKGKGKGKLFTTAAAIGIGSILNKDR
jgi:hypothetical protein